VFFLLGCLIFLIAEMPALLHAQGYPSGGIQPITGSGGRTPQGNEIPSAPLEVKPDKAATKAYAAGMKSMLKAHELEDTIAKATDPDKKAKALAKLDDTYGKALEEFTEVLRNKNDMYDAWNKIGFIHLHFGAYRESIDDYNHTLALKPDLEEAIEYRGEAYMGIDHLDDAKATYMELFFPRAAAGGSNDGGHASLVAKPPRCRERHTRRGHRRLRQVAAGTRRYRENGSGELGHAANQGVRPSASTLARSCSTSSSSALTR